MHRMRPAWRDNLRHKSKPIPFDLQKLTWLVWLDAAQETYEDSAKTTPAADDADPVGCWADLSGNANDFLQATAGKRPTLQLNEINGYPVIQFDGSDDILAHPDSLTTGQAGTVIGLYKYVTGDTLPTILLASADEAGTTRVSLQPVRATTTFVGMTDGTNALDGNSANKIDTVHVAAFSSNATRTRMWLDGAAQNLTEGGTFQGVWWGDFAGRDNMTIGGVKPASPTYRPGHFGLILIAATELTPDDIMRVHDFIANKYALTTIDVEFEGGHGIVSIV